MRSEEFRLTGPEFAARTRVEAIRQGHATIRRDGNLETVSNLAVLNATGAGHPKKNPDGWYPTKSRRLGRAQGERGPQARKFHASRQRTGKHPLIKVIESVKELKQLMRSNSGHSHIIAVDEV